MGTKNSRYKNIQQLIEGRQIKTFKEIFEYISKETLSEDLGIHYRNFVKLVNNPDYFSIREIDNCATLLQVDFWQIIALIQKQKPIPNK